MDFGDTVLKMLGEAFSWLTSKIEAFFKFLSEKVDKSFTCLKRFYDDKEFSQKLKQALATSKAVVMAAMEKVAKTMSSIKNLFVSSMQKVKKSLTKLRILINSLSKELGDVISGIRRLVDLMYQAKKVAGNGFRIPDILDKVKFNESNELEFGSYDNWQWTLFEILYEAVKLFGILYKLYYDYDHSITKTIVGVEYCALVIK